MKQDADKERCLLWVIVAGILLSLLASLMYGNILHAPFVFDDFQYIKLNTYVHLKDLSWQQLAYVLEGPAANRPLPMFSFALNHYFGGFNTEGYHLVNITLHCLVGVALFMLARQLLQLSQERSIVAWICPRHRNLLALGTTLLWFTHPLHIQSVTYISQRMNSMAALFFILCIWAYGEGRRRLPESRSAGFFALCALTALGAFMSKQNTATLPFFLLLYEWCFYRDGRIHWLVKRAWLLPLLALPAYLMTRFIDSKDFLAVDATIIERWLTQLRVNVHYLVQLIYPEPSQRNFDYAFSLSSSLFEPWTTFASALILMGCLGGLLYTFRTNRLIAFCLAWYAGNLVIESYYVRYELVCDYRTYLPSMLIPLALGYLSYRWLRPHWLTPIVLVLLIGLFAYWTHTRNEVWRSDIAFWGDHVNKSPGKARVWNNLGHSYLQHSEYARALPFFEKAYKLRPEYSGAYANAGFAYMMLQRWEAARVHYHKALELKDDNFAARNNLAAIYLYAKQWEAARELYLDNLALQPKNKLTHNNLALACKELGLRKEAHQHLSQALAIDSRYPDALFNMGLFLFEQGDYAPSISYLKRFLILNPDHSRAQRLLEEAQQARLP